VAFGSEFGQTALTPTRSTLSGLPRTLGMPDVPATPPAPGKRPGTRPGMPSASSVDYAHKLGQAGVLWAGIAVFGLYLLRGGDPSRLARGLMRKHVAG
jgi:hypothetical protein